MVNHTQWNCMVFPIIFPKHQKMQQNPPYELSSCFSTVLFVILVPKSGYTLKEQTEQIDKVNIVFLIIIPQTLESKTKCTKGKRGNACNFSKKEGNQYILGKSKTNLHKIFVTFNNRLRKLHLLLKNFNEKRNNRVICKEIFLGFQFFKKQSNQYSLCYRVMLWLLCFANFFLSFVGTVLLNSLIL